VKVGGRHKAHKKHRGVRMPWDSRWEPGRARQDQRGGPANFLKSEGGEGERGDNPVS